MHWYKVFGNKGLSFKLILFFSASSILIYFILSGFNYRFSRRLIEKNVEENARNLTLSTVHRIEAILKSVEKTPEHLKYFLETASYTRPQILDIIKTIVENDPEIYGSTISYEPYAFEKKLKFFAPYYYKQNNKTLFCYIEYDYRDWDWYSVPKKTGKSYWTEPYFDEGAGNIIMTTYSAPVYKADKTFLGVATADISLEWLTAMITSIKISETGYGFLISRNGAIVTHPLKDFIMKETVFTVAEKGNDPELMKIGKKMIKGESGFGNVKNTLTGQPCWMYYAPVPSTGWCFAVLFPKDELLSDVRRLNRTVAALALAGVALLMFVTVFIARSITRPLKAMAQAAGTIATGNLEAPLPAITSEDEVGQLTKAMSYMQKSLRDYISRLTETTAAKERIESELDIAKSIQLSIIPRTFPPFPDRREIDIYASIEPARTVGGDLYDFFFIDDNHLCLAIGDVSGKGVPAALFMAITRTFLRAKTVKGLTAGKIVESINNDLALDNENSMFVTFFLLIMDVTTGKIEYCNAGHNFPYLIKKDGSLLRLNQTHGCALGVLAGVEYRQAELIMAGGEKFALYTDGVTEAMSINNELFTETRLEKVLSETNSGSPKDITTGIIKAVKSHSEGAEQSDDITIVVLEKK